jgi:hypothetical protein
MFWVGALAVAGAGIGAATASGKKGSRGRGALKGALVGGTLGLGGSAVGLAGMGGTGGFMGVGMGGAAGAGAAGTAAGVGTGVAPITMGSGAAATSTPIASSSGILSGQGSAIAARSMAPISSSASGMGAGFNSAMAGSGGSLSGAISSLPKAASPSMWSKIASNKALQAAGINMGVDAMKGKEPEKIPPYTPAEKQQMEWTNAPQYGGSLAGSLTPEEMQMIMSLRRSR